MLFIETNKGNFGKFKDIFLFMQEENLTQIEILKVDYCLDEVIGKGLYTLDQIENIVKGAEK